MNNLKSCPFCGGNPQLQYDDIDNSYTIECANKECNMSPSTPCCDTEEGAIEYWNDRVDNQDNNTEKQIKPCPFCGETPITEIGLARYGRLGDCIAIKVVCAECHVVKSVYIREGTDFDTVRKSMDKIIEEWNKRVLNPTDIDNNMMDHPKKICEKCGRVVFWNSYFQDYICCCFVDDGVAEDESIEYK